MPLLDVSFVVNDPMLADTFSVTRRLNSVGTNGRVSALPVENFDDLVGVITQQSPGAFMATEVGQSIPRRIFVASQFQFIAAAEGYSGDEIAWDNGIYVVTEIFPYSRYGRGICECMAETRRVIPKVQQ